MKLYVEVYLNTVGVSNAGYFPPRQDRTSRPVAIVMSGDFFNGNLQVFSIGADGVVKQIWQTTCDKVDDLWG